MDRDIRKLGLGLGRYEWLNVECNGQHFRLRFVRPVGNARLQIEAPAGCVISREPGGDDAKELTPADATTARKAGRR